MEENQVRICVPACTRTPPEVKQAISRAAQSGDMIELRLDCLNFFAVERLVQIARLTSELKQKVIITFRAIEQGGCGSASVVRRLEFWIAAIELFKEELLDMELEMVQTFTGPSNPLDWKRVICSHHDFSGVPSDLIEIYERMAAKPPAILKIAVQANDISDCIPVFHLLERARSEGRQLIGIAMGPAGVATRILGPSRGAYLTYGSLADDSTTAPGQVTAKELRDVYRIDKIDRHTQITGLIGNPVSHSLSPQIQNQAFDSAGVNAVFIPFAVHDVNRFMDRMVHPRSRELDWNLRGLSVTAPHKVKVMQHLDWIDPLAKEIGAVNTIVIDADTLRGYNTDALAALKPVSERLGALRDSRCAVIGAGGAANAVLWSLKNEGASATVFARDQEKGTALAEKFDAGCEPLEGASFKEFDFVINATPLGTRGALEGETAATAVQLRGARLAYDLVYNPRETLFLKEARDAGCDTIGGLAMLVLQAAEQFNLWTGAEAPLGEMRDAAERAVSL